MISTIYDYLGIPSRDEKRTAMFVLEHEKLNKTQLSKLTGKTVMLEEKLDGVFSFVVAKYKDGRYEVEHFGRSGKLQQNCEMLNMKCAMEFHKAQEYRGSMVGVYISEVTSDSPLAVLSGYMTPTRVEDASVIPVNRKDNFHDVMTIEDFTNGVCHKQAMERHNYLQARFRKTDLIIIPYEVMSYEEAVEKSKRWIREGKEGGVLRLPSGIWEAGKRDYRIIKVKEKLSYDVTVIGMCSGKEGSKYENTLGKLLVLFRAFGNTIGEPIEIPVSGMTDAQRGLWWGRPELIIGKVVKMDAKSFTEFGNLREPRYKETRHDKGPDFGCYVLINREPKVSTKAKCRWIEYPYQLLE